MRPNLNRLTSCRYIFATRYSRSGRPMNGICSFFQNCSNAAGELGPSAKIVTPRLVNFSYSSRKRANCARQYGHINPRKKASTTGLPPLKSESLMLSPCTSISSKSGASSPGVSNALICLRPPKIWPWHRQFVVVGLCVKCSIHYHLVENHNPQIEHGSRLE